MQISAHVCGEKIIHYTLVFTSIRNILEVLIPAKHIPVLEGLDDHL